MTRQDLFLSVLEANKGIIYKVANAYCKDREERRDLIQEISVQLWRSFDTYDPQFKRSTWLYRIALNVAISFYRKSVRRQRFSGPVPEEELLSVAVQEPDEIEAELDLLRQFLAELRELDRALMILYLEDNSHRQIADILGLSPSNVATRIGRIKQQLRTRFSTFKNT